jgi:DNA modification methylase
MTLRGKHKILLGDCRDLLRELPENSVDAIVTDPPYGLEFMGKEWDRLAGDRRQPGDPTFHKSGVGQFDRATVRYGYDVDMHAMQDWHYSWAVEAFRVLKPGGHLLAFGGTRTFHRLACAIEDAGFEVRDTLCWLHGQGFPKGLNVQQAMNKAARGCPQGTADPESPNHGKFKGGCSEDNPEGRGFGAGAGAFMEEQGCARGGDDGPWNGWNVALKPAFEPIVLARKPLSESNVAANVLKWGTGAINVNACRIGLQGEQQPTGSGKGFDAVKGFGQGATQIGNQITCGGDKQTSPQGRWPANVLLGHFEDQTCPACNGDGIQHQPAGTLIGLCKRCSAEEGGLWSRVKPDALRCAECRRPVVDVREETTPVPCPVCCGSGKLPGCVCRGTKRVDGNGHWPASRPASTTEAGPQGHAGQDDLDERTSGDEEVEAWECHPDCPVRLLDEQSGITTSGAMNREVAGYPGESATPFLRGRSGPSNQHGGTGGASRFFAQFGGSETDGEPTRFRYVAKAGRRERFAYLTCNCKTVKLCAWRKSEKTAVFISPQKDTCGERSTDEKCCSTSPSGSKQMDLFQKDTACITSTKTKPTTDSTTCNSSPTQSTNEYTPDANSSTESGTSHVVFAGESFQSLPETFICPPKDGRFTGVVVGATSPLWSGVSKCDGCGCEVKRNQHPTQKPVDLIRYLVRLVTPPGGTVLDCFLGTGTGAVAAQEEGFTIIGIEQDPEYLAIAQARLDDSITRERERKHRDFLPLFD